MRQVKRVLCAALAFLPLLAAMMAVNWFSDPANILRTGYEKQVAEILASGENAGNLRNMDDRGFMRAYAGLRAQPIDTLVLGSSHSMQVTQYLTGDENTFCAGMTGADLRDCISAYLLFRQQGFAPRRVILAVDPWFLSVGALEDRAMTDGYVQFCQENGFTPLGLDRFKGEELQKKMQIFSLTYFQSSVQALKQGQYKTRDAVPTTAYYTEGDMRRADGSYCYGARVRDPQSGYAREQVANIIYAKPDFAVKFDGVSDQLVAQLTAFVRLMQADGAQVALMAAPYHPDYYDHMAKQTDNYVEILATEDVIRAVGRETGAKVFGGYDPHAFGLTAEDFYDGMHCSDKAMYAFYPADLFDGLESRPIPAA